MTPSILAKERGREREKVRGERLKSMNKKSLVYIWGNEERDMISQIGEYPRQHPDWIRGERRSFSCLGAANSTSTWNFMHCLLCGGMMMITEAGGLNNRRYSAVRSVDCSWFCVLPKKREDRQRQSEHPKKKVSPETNHKVKHSAISNGRAKKENNNPLVKTRRRGLQNAARPFLHSGTCSAEERAYKFEKIISSWSPF